MSGLCTSINPVSTPGIMSASSILGPAVGYILGGSLLNIYVDYPKSPPR